MTYGQTAAEFMAALQRFTYRRNASSDIYSDNGLNFTATERNLQEIR